ncbi:MAG: undecaprenyl-phosphate glucose phosphotransferase [Bacteroidota bacterium]|jgi:putative colanic acid biosynthesis UDP-glucose lipid carrier transferase
MDNSRSFYTFLRYFLDAFAILLSFIILKSYKPFQFDRLFHLTFFLLSSIIIWYLASIHSKLYAERRSNKFSEEIIFNFYNSITFAVLFSAALFFQKEKITISFWNYLSYISYVFVLSTLFKYVHRKYIHSILSEGKMYTNILLVGANSSAEFLYETINKYYYYGYKCIGFLDDHQTKLNGNIYLGKIKDINSVLNNERVDEVVITLSNDEYENINHCVQSCELKKVQIKMLPDTYKYSTSSIQIDNIGIVPVLNINSLPLDKIENKITKRIFDIIFAITFFCTLGIVLLPLIAILIKLTSKGPILFSQERWGLNNEKIICYKFRTMTDGSPEVDMNGKYQPAILNDPRTTSIGRFLRKTNLDELPQFWNVLTGNMSIVGPRPHPTPMNIESMGTIDNYMLRHIVLPGITGWAQVNGLRGEIRSIKEMQARVDFDLYYIHRWTFWMDCQIILQTMINFVRGDQNAY